MAVRPLLPAALLSLATLLAGCSDAFDGKAIKVQQTSEVTAASGPDGSSGDCDGDGNLAYTLARRAGSIRILIADEDGQVLHDSGKLDGAPDGFGGDSAVPVSGPAGEWSVSVERTAFTGSYSVAVTC